MPPRLNKQALFRDVGYEPHPGQLAVHESRAPRRVLACGVRWGKTQCAVMEVVCALLEPRDSASLGWVVGPDHTVSDRILRLARGVLERRVPQRIISMAHHTLRVRNLTGRVSVAEGRSADNPASLLGEGLDWLIVDEAARLKDEIWDEHLSQRLVEKRGWAFFLSTPRGANWFYRAFRRGRGEDPAYQSWTGPTWDNPHIERAVVEEERRRLTAEVFEQEYGGRFIGPGIPQCEVCGYPRAEHVIALLRNSETLDSCSACGHLIMRDGRALAFDLGTGPMEHSVRLIERRRPDPSILVGGGEPHREQ